jgi:predicted hotdog family 3-hydroxylacyl-ACP dehydratase
MKVTKESINQYIPHRAPFVMIDNLVTATAERFESDFHIEPENVLVEDGFFQESGLLENIAQTCAASFGFLDSEAETAPKIGFIGAITRVQVYELPPVGSTIFTVVTPSHQLGNIYLVQGESFLEGRILLGCEMKIVVSE